MRVFDRKEVTGMNETKGESSYKDPSNYINRELSWVLFDKRVLGEARDKQNRCLRGLSFLVSQRLIWMSFSW